MELKLVEFSKLKKPIQIGVIKNIKDHDKSIFVFWVAKDSGIYFLKGGASIAYRVDIGDIYDYKKVDYEEVGKNLVDAIKLVLNTQSPINGNKILGMAFEWFYQIQCHCSSKMR